MLERFVVNRADRVVFVSEANRVEFAEHYGPALSSKFEVVRNGCDVTEFEQVQPVRRPSDRFVLLHAGSLYGGRTPAPLLEALSEAIRDGDIDPQGVRVRFLGPNALDDTHATCERLGLGGVVEFVPRVPREEGLLAMASASCLLLLQPGHSVSVPGKLYEYIATGRPIFAIAEEGETADVVRRTGFGVSVPPANRGAIRDALVALCRQGWVEPEPAPRSLYDGAIGALAIAGILESTVSSRCRAGEERRGSEPSAAERQGVA